MKPKFRAWDSDGKEMFRVVSMHFPSSGPIIVSGRGGSMAIGKGDALMQFTGLKDKNGKEIFEGDIFKNGTLIRPISVDEQHGYRFHFGLDRLTRGDADYGEVIGNIYENPELLK